MAVVTGASSGIGAHAARVLSAAGAAVVLAARRTDRIEALAAELPDAVAVSCDVADDDACAELVATTMDRFGRLDVLVNNAGISDAPARAESEDPADFRAVVRVNLDAVFVLSRLAAEPMLAAGSGSIVNVASVHGLVASAPNAQAAYVATKGAVVMLTKELACQWARSGVRVNALAPGYFETELTGEMFTGDASGRTWIERNTPLRRAGELEELSGPLLLLCGDAGSYMTGHTLVVDGGWTAR